MPMMKKNECRIGDEVQIIETRPLSKLKRFRVTQITKKSRLILRS